MYKRSFKRPERNTRFSLGRTGNSTAVATVLLQQSFTNFLFSSLPIKGHILKARPLREGDTLTVTGTT